MNPTLCMRGAGYHDGFVIPAGATNIQITEDPVNPSVHFGECVYIHVEVKPHLIYKH